VLDLGDLIDMLEGNLATNIVAGVHGAAQAVLAGLDIGRVKEEIGGCWGAEVESEGSVRTDSDAGGNGDTGVDVSGTSVEFLI
jgi:hypothetical protein